MNLHPSIPSFDKAATAAASKKTEPLPFKVNPIQERMRRKKPTGTFSKPKPILIASAGGALPPGEFYKVGNQSSSIFAQLVSGNIQSLPTTNANWKATGGDEDNDEISRENEARLLEMTKEEILAEKEALLKRFGKDMLTKLKDLKKPSSIAAVTPTSVEQDTTATNFVTETFPKLAPTEQKKVQWMLEEEDQEATNDLKTTPRLDLFGDLVEDSEEAEFQNELYHHAGPNVPGYTVEDLIHLARSKMAPQRAIAFRALAGFLKNRLERPAKFANISMHQGQALMAIRMGLDIEDCTSLPWAIESLYYFLIPRNYTMNSNNTRGLGLGYLDWGVTPRAQGSPLVNAPALEILPTLGSKEEEERETAELNDVQLAEFSPTLALLRSNIVTRLCYLLLGSTTTDAVNEQQQQQKLIAILLFITRAQSPADRALDENALFKLVMRLPDLDLLLGLVNSSKSLCQRICVQEEDYVQRVLVSKLTTTTQDFTELNKVVYVLRACVLHGQLVDRVPHWVQNLCEIVENATDVEQEVNAASTAVDIITYFCQQQTDPMWFDRLASVAQMAQHFCMDLSRIRISSSAVRLLESHSRLGRANVDRSFNGVLIFLGNLLAMRNTLPALEFWDAVKSSTLALKTMCAKDLENAKYFACSPLFQDLWQEFKLEQPVLLFPTTQAQGILFLTKNQAFVNFLDLEREVRAHQFDEDQIPLQEWRRVMASQIALRCGGHTVFTLRCIYLLLASFGADLQEELVPLFEDLLQCSTSEDDTSFVVCRALEHNFKLMARVGLAWPCLPLLLCRNLSVDVYVECIRFALEMKESMDERTLGCLLSFAATSEPQVLDMMRDKLCELFDWFAVHQTALSHISVVVALLGGPDKLLVLAQDVSRKLTEQMFEDPFLERCIMLLLQDGMPLQVRLSVWNTLVAGRSLPSQAWLPSARFGREDEILQHLAGVITEDLRARDWIIAHAKKELTVQLANKPEAWISRRLKRQLQDNNIKLF